MDVHHAAVRQTEVKSRVAIEIAKVQADAEVRKAEVEARSREALMRAEADLIKTRAEHVDAEMLWLSQQRELTQLRSQTQLKMVTLACGTMLIIVILALAH